jgi:hypothetical protein
MPSSSNGRHGGQDDPIRRLRYDDLSAIMERTYGRGPLRAAARTRAAAIPWISSGTSGRRFVVLAVIAVLVVWGSLYLVFREWRARYRERAAYGAGQVAPAVDAFTDVKPPGVDAARWRDAVIRTHAMLVTITGSNLLGLSEMQDLRAELDGAVARAKAHPDAAVAELAAIWDDMSERGEFLLRDTRSLTGERHPRPEILPSYGADRVAPALDLLGEMAPPGLPAEQWRNAVADTRALVLVVTSSGLINTMRMKDLRADLDRGVARAREHPESAIKELARIWDSLHRSCQTLYVDRKAAIDGQIRPSIFPPP